MAYHTWIYKKATALDNNEKEKIVVEEIKTLKNWWGFKMPKTVMIDKIDKLFYRHNMPQLKDTPEEYTEKLLAEYSAKLKDYEEKGFEAFIKYHKNDYPTCFNYNNELYVQIDCDTPFRCFDFATEKITTIKDLMYWLKNNQNLKFGYYDENTKDYIIGYTENLINRIQNYFHQHGENNLLFDFG